MLTVGTTGKKVDFTNQNISLCLCGECPVQAGSSCVMEKKAKSMQMEHLNPVDIPGLYCATGKATCPDLKLSKRCNCPGCMVWAEHDLSSNHYCAWGSAEERSV
ncbi:MAG: DUF2769 domain-containing protein [Candidatus Latescibacterota bacterium]